MKLDGTPCITLPATLQRVHRSTTYNVLCQSQYEGYMTIVSLRCEDIEKEVRCGISNCTWPYGVVPDASLYLAGLTCLCGAQRTRDVCVRVIHEPHGDEDPAKWTSAVSAAEKMKVR